MLQIKNLLFKYPNSDFNLQIANLKIATGSRTAFIGPSGSGKTTLLNLLAGIVLPEQGSISWGAAQINQYNESKRRAYRIQNIGFIFQDFKLINYLSVMDNILLPYRINNKLKLSAETKERARSLAAFAGIEKHLSKYATKLSQGEKQRVAICRALVNEPEIILADEPTGNLDPRNKERTMELLYDYCKRQKATLITVTHDHELLSGFEEIVDFSKLLDLQ